MGQLSPSFPEVGGPGDFFVFIKPSLRDLRCFFFFLVKVVINDSHLGINSCSEMLAMFLI